MVRMRREKMPNRGRFAIGCLLTVIVCAIIVVTPSQAQIPTNGLVAYYPFKGNAKDSSGNGNNGTVIAATRTTNMFGDTSQAYYFSGTSPYIDCGRGTSLNSVSALTLSAWIKTDTLAGRIISKRCSIGGGNDGGYELDIANPWLRFGYNGYIYATVNISAYLNTWIHVAATFDGAYSTLYINGVGTVPNASPAMNAADTANLTIGKSYSIPQTYFRGSIDEVCIYNRALNDAEIQSLCQQKYFVADYRFSKNTIDSSYNGNDGINNGATDAPDRFGNANRAYDFNGTSAYINCGNAGSLNMNNALTLSAWIMPHSLTEGRIISKWGSGSGYEMDVFNGNIEFGINQNNYLTTNISNLLNTWIHIVGTYDRSSAKIYVNGVLRNSLSRSEAIGNSSFSLLIGEMANMAVSYFDGLIDDVRIYNRALREGEVDTLYNEGGWAEDKPLVFEPYTISGVHLNDQITADTAANGWVHNRVYVLRRNGFYLWDSIFVVPAGRTIQLRAEYGTAGVDPIIYLYSNTLGGRPPVSMLDIRGDVNLKHIIASGCNEPYAPSLDSLQGTFLRVLSGATGVNLNIDSCILKTTNGNHIRTDGQPATIKVTNTIFADLGFLGTSNLGAGKAIDLRGQQVDTCYVQNCTFVNFHDRIIRHYMSSGPIKNLIFDHNTIVNGMSYHGMLSLGWVDSTGLGTLQITNNLLLDAFSLGADTDYIRQAEFTDSGEKDPINGFGRMTWVIARPNTSAIWNISNNYYGISDSGAYFFNAYPFYKNEGSPLTWGINARLSVLGRDTLNAFKKINVQMTNTPQLMTVMNRWYYRPLAEGGAGKTKSTVNFTRLSPGYWQSDYNRRTAQYYFDTLDCSFQASETPVSTDGKVVGDVRWSFQGVIPVVPRPTITSLVPISGPVGAIVNINGRNFNAILANNAVYFGATKATVSAANDTLLRVTVPAGAVYAPLTVTDLATGLTGYSAQPFDVLFPANNVFDTSSFAAQIGVPTGNSPYSAEVGDIDGDGKSDVVVTDYSDNTFSVFRNVGTIGDIRFSSKVSFAAGSNPYGAAIGDIDGDGKLDVAVTNVGSSTVSVFRNTSTVGTVSFSSRTELETGSNPYGIAIHDIDGDGKPDIVVANYSSGTVSVFKNKSTVGTLSFGSGLNFTAGSNPYDVAIGDLDGDGNPDMAAVNYASGTVSVFGNTSANGIINFSPKLDLTAGTQPYSIALGDLDGDGKPDLIATNIVSNSVSSFRNKSAVGALSFAAKVDFPVGTAPWGVALGDLDGDGKVDVVTADYNGGTVSAFKNISTSNSVNLASCVNFTAGIATPNVAVGDIDGDGKPDIVAANIGTNTISVFCNKIAPLLVTSVSPGPNALNVVKDPRISLTFNHDIDQSTISSSTICMIGSQSGKHAFTWSYNVASRTVTLSLTAPFSPGELVTVMRARRIRSLAGDSLANSGSWSFTIKTEGGLSQFQQIAALGVDNYPSSVTTGDWNGDGFLDLAVPNKNSNSVSFLMNDGHGGSLQKMTMYIGSSPKSAAGGDWNGDGLLDLAMVNSGTNTVSILRNDIGSFFQIATPSVGSSPISVIAGDWNLDGSLDLAVVNNGSNTVSILLNDGTGNFLQSSTPNVGNSPYSIIAGDWNSDALLDLAVVNFGSNTVSILRGDGNGGFLPISEVPAGSNPVAVACGDWNKDGTLDLAVSNSGSDSVSILLNNGSGSFFRSSTVSVGRYPYSIVTGDLNGDGSLDLAVSNYNSNTLSILRGDGNGGFTHGPTIIVGTNPISITGGDWNGDGVFDLAVANAASNTVSILLNPSIIPNPPANLVAFAGNGQAKLAWNRNREPDFLRYRIYCATGGGKKNLVDSTSGGITDTARIMFGLTNGQAYSYNVTAVDSSGLESSFSNEATVTPLITILLLGEYKSDPNTVLLLHLNEAAGTTVSDASSYSNHGILNGTTVVAGRFGNSKDFVDADCITVPSSVSLNVGSGDFTIDAWVKRPNISGAEVLAKWGSASESFFAFSIGSDGVLRFETSDGSTSYAVTGGSIPSEVWQHVAAVRQGTALSIYQNGVRLRTYQATSVHAISNSGSVRSSASGPALHGSLDEIRMSNNARQPFEFSLQLPPKGLVSGAPGNNLSLTWHNGGGAVPLMRYRIFRGSDSTSMALIDSTADTTYFRSGLAPATNFYRVTAMDSTGFESIRSYAVSATIRSNAAIPAISSVTPFSGPVGTAVTIAGSNFNPTASNNVVYFGAVRAVINSATSTSLNLTVPFGATYVPISATDITTGLTAYSAQPFTVTLSNIQVINVNSFAPRVDFAAGTSPHNLVIADIDVDGKPDVAVGNTVDNTISVLRNTSASGNISTSSLAGKVDFSTGTNPQRIAFADLDGDGKLDLALSNFDANTLSVLHNTSASGSITSGSFAPRVDFVTGTNPAGVAIADIDSDGKPDIIVTNVSSNTVSVFRNVGVTGSITAGSFAAKADFAVGTAPYGLAAADLDGDGWVDLAVANYGSNAVTLLRNTSSSGNITFNRTVDLNARTGPATVVIADIDGDSRLDLVVPNWIDPSFSVYRNANNMLDAASFAVRIDWPTNHSTDQVAVTDLDGDSKPDVVIAYPDTNTISVFGNTSTSGTLSTASFAAKVDFFAGGSPNGVVVADIDGDTYPDLIVSNYRDNTVSIFRRTVGAADVTAPSITFDPNSVSSVIVSPSGSVNNAAPTISAQANDEVGGSGVKKMTLQYRQTGSLSWQSSENLSGTINYQLPTGIFSFNNHPIGVDYRIGAEDNAGNVSMTAVYSIDISIASGNTITNPTALPNATSFQSSERFRAYRAFSVPYDLVDKKPGTMMMNWPPHENNGVQYVRWRLQRYVNEVREDYEGFKDQDAIQPGAAFFFITTEQGIALSVGSGKVVKASLMNDVGIPLTRGWNLVGNPLLVDIPIDSLRFSRGPIVQHAYYSGTTTGTSGWEMSGTAADVLKPWEGLAIRVDTAGILTFKAIGPQPNIVDRSLGPRLVDVAAKLKKGTSNWMVTVNASRPDIGMRCIGSGLGMIEGASERRDEYDSYMPPFVGDKNVALYFSNPDGSMMRDIRPLNDTGGVWPMHVITGDAQARVKLQFGDVSKLPDPDFEAYLIDLDQKMAFNLKKVSTVELGSGNGTRNLNVVIGKPAFVEQNNSGIELNPSTMRLFANYPNPFNPETVIRFTVPNAAPLYRVALKIFNIVGQEVATLVSDQRTSGYYEVRWDARGHSSGVYFYRISMTDGVHTMSATQKMLMIK